MLTALEIGKRIAEARKKRGVSQAQIANHLAISPQAVGKWERGESLPDIITLDRLAEYLGLGLDYFSERSSGRLPIEDDEVPKSKEEPGSGIEPESESKASAKAEAESESESDSKAASMAWLESEPESKPEVEPKQESEQSFTDTQDVKVSLPEEDTHPAPEMPTWDCSSGDWRDSDFSGLDNLAEQLKGSNIKRCLFIGSSLQNLELSGSSVVDSSFREADLSHALFKGCSFVRDTFDSSDLSHTTIKGSSVTDCSFVGATLRGATIEGSSVKRCKLQGAAVAHARFIATQLSGITFTGEISSCTFDNCSFSEVYFRDAVLTKTFFKGRSMKKVRFINCSADRTTLVFLNNAKADTTGISVIV